MRIGAAAVFPLFFIDGFDDQVVCILHAGRRCDSITPSALDPDRPLCHVLGDDRDGGQCLHPVVLLGRTQ